MPKERKLVWNEAETKKFVDILYEYKMKHAKNDWGAFVRLFRESTGIAVEKYQLKSRYDILKNWVRSYEELIKCTGVGVDPHTTLPICSDEQWERLKAQYHFRQYHFRESLRTQRIPDFERMRAIFSGQTATGEMSFAPGMDDLSMHREGSGDSDDVLGFGGEPAPMSEGDTESHSPPRRDSGKGKGKKRKGDSSGQGRSKRQSTGEVSTPDFTLDLVKAKEIAAAVRSHNISPAQIAQAGERVQRLLIENTGSDEYLYEAMEAVRCDLEYFSLLPTDRAAWKMLCAKMGMDPGPPKR